MITTISITSSVPEKISRQIREMGAEYSDELAMDAFHKSSPLNIVGRAMMNLELGTYMSAMGRHDAEEPGLIIAIDDEKKDVVLGFLLYAPLSGASGQCGIIYTAVSTKMRKQGILRQMLAKVSEHFLQSTLSCQISLVPMYEHLGYHVIGHRNSQIVMTNGKTPSLGRMRLMNPESAMHHPMVLQANSEMILRFGQEQIRNSLIKHSQDMEAKQAQAEAFAKAKIAS
jgi:predicted GNAT family acetyltransferase